MIYGPSVQPAGITATDHLRLFRDSRMASSATEETPLLLTGEPGVQATDSSAHSPLSRHQSHSQISDRGDTDSETWAPYYSASSVCSAVLLTVAIIVLVGLAVCLAGYAILVS